MIHILAAICSQVLLIDLHTCAVEYALILLMRGTGLTQEADCAWCAPGKYQTGVGVMAEANCTWCVAGKYQSGSGLKTAFLLSVLVWWLSYDIWLSSVPERKEE
jgi:hypothetical protein